MQKINNYILEKLHIGKDYKVNLLCEDRIFGIIRVFKDNNENILSISQPYKLLKMVKDQIHYTVTNTYAGFLLSGLSENSKGYYESIDEVDKDVYRVFVPGNQIIKLLDKFESIKNLGPYLYDNFFDNKDTFLNEKDWRIANTQDKISYLQKEYKQSLLKESVNEKLYIDKKYKQPDIFDFIENTINDYCKNELKMDINKVDIAYFGEENNTITNKNIDDVKIIYVYSDDFRKIPINMNMLNVANDLKKRLRDYVDIKKTEQFITCIYFGL